MGKEIRLKIVVGVIMSLLFIIGISVGETAKAEEIAGSETTDVVTARGVYGTSPWEWVESTQTLKFYSGEFPNVISRDNSIRAVIQNTTELSAKPIKVIRFEGKVSASESSSYLFASLPELQVVENLELFDTSKVIDFSNAFYSCKKLVRLNVSNWDTSNVENMGKMFYYNYNLSGLDVSNWDTSNVRSMGSMFSEASSLSELDVSKWNISNVIGMTSMFSGASSLLELDVSKWDTSKVENMNYMFSGTHELRKLDVANWNTSNLKSIKGMFQYSRNLLKLDVSNWDVSQVLDMSYVFMGASKLEELDVSSWATSKVTHMEGMFNSASNIRKLDVSNWDTSRVQDMSTMFNKTKNLTELDVSKWDTSNLTVARRTFSGTEKLTKLDVSNWDTSNIYNMNNMFTDTNLIELNLSNWDMSSIIFISNMFTGSNLLTKIILGEKSIIKDSGVPEITNDVYTGRWVLDNRDQIVTFASSGDLMSRYDGTAPGVYIRERVVDPTKVLSVTMTPATFTLAVGKSKLLYPVVSPETAINKNVTYRSSDPSVAKVLSNGKVQAIGQGTATITVTTEDGSYTAQSIFTVN